MSQVIYVRAGKRFNIYAPATINEIQYPNFLAEDVRYGLGITAVTLPSPPVEYWADPELWYVVESDFAPWAVYTQKSPEQIQAILYKRYETILDEHLDGVAQSYGFGDRTRLALRAGYLGSRQKLGAAFGTWMDACNDLAKQLYIDVNAGKVAMPSTEDFVKLLPEFEFTGE